MNEHTLRTLVETLRLEADVAVRLGLADRQLVLDRLEDTLVNELDDADDGAAAAAVALAELTAHVDAGLAALAAEEVSWPARTPTERVEEALADLASKGQGCSRLVRIDRGGGFHERVDDDPWPPEDAPTWYVDYVVEPLADGLAARATFRHVTDAKLRADELEAAAKEVLRVLRHHGVEAAYDAERRHVGLAPFPWQRRRTTPSPPPAALAPPAPVVPVCPLCRGKGWVVASANDFPAPCACRNSGLR